MNAKAKARVLPIDWVDLEIAFRDATGSESYIDLESGEVVIVMKGFEDERDIKDKLSRHPQRFLPLPTVDASFTRNVLRAFIAHLGEGKSHAPVRKKLEKLDDGPGVIAAAMAILRADKPCQAAYARFEQGELWRVIEHFLAAHGIAAATQAPAVELFE